MIIGLKKWNDPDTYFTQTNNPTEEILRKEDGKGWLESCGPTAAVNCLAAASHKVTVETPGRYYPQPEEVLTDWFNDPRNYPRLEKIREGVDPAEWMGNEVPQYYPEAILDVFGVLAKFSWGSGYDEITAALKQNKGVMVCLKKPSHFIAIVAYKELEVALVYRDPWPGNTWPVRWRGKTGFNRSIEGRELENLQPYRIEVG